MSERFSQIAFENDLKEIFELGEFSDCVRVDGSLTIIAAFRPDVAANELFEARLHWDKYPTDPPSLKFRDTTTGRLDVPTAWPVLPGFRPLSLDACVNWCAEGFTLHPEWRNDPNGRWNPGGNALLKVIRILQAQFNRNYGGRFKQ